MPVGAEVGTTPFMMQQPPGAEPVYVISVAARLAGLPSWVLRVLDQEGVVVPSRTDSNRRLYSDQDIARLARVRHLTEERGVNIAGVKVIMEMEQERDSILPTHAAPADESGSPPAEKSAPFALPPYVPDDAAHTAKP